MKIKTEYNLGDTVSFHPFGKIRYTISGEIKGISIFVQKEFPKGKKIEITYSVNVTLGGKTESWSVSEKSVLKGIKK